MPILISFDNQTKDSHQCKTLWQGFPNCNHCQYWYHLATRLEIQSNVKHPNKFRNANNCNHCQYWYHLATRLKIHINVKHPNKFRKANNCNQCQSRVVAGLECRLAQRVESHLLSNLYQPPNFTMTPSVGQQTIGEKSFGAYQTSLPAGKQLHTKSKMRRFPVLSGFQAQADYRGYTSETTEEKPTSKRKR